MRRGVTGMVVVVVASLLLAATQGAERGLAAGEPLVTVGVELESADFDSAGYAVMVINHGTGAADGVVVSIPVPQSTTFASSSPAPASPACTSGASPATACEWSLPSLAPGERTTMTVAYDVVRPATESFDFNVTVPATVRATGAPDDTDSDRSLRVKRAVPTEDVYVDPADAANVNHGTCPELRLSADNAVTSYIDDENFYPGASQSSDPSGHQLVGAERMFYARLSTEVTSTSGPATLAMHRVIGEWDEGSGNCGTAPCPNFLLQDPCTNAAGSVARPARRPVSAPAATATVQVAGPGAVSWDLMALLETEEQRMSWNGVELRNGGGGAAMTLAAGEAAAGRPTLDGVWEEYEDATRCIEATPETANLASDGNQRIDVYVSEGGHKVDGTNVDDACSGWPAEGEQVIWQVEDDAPQVRFVETSGGAVAPESGGGPDSAAAATDADGRAFAVLAGVDPYAAAASAGETRVGAQVRNGATDPSDSGCATSNNCVIESLFEDDVLAMWTAAAAPPPPGAVPECFDVHAEVRVDTAKPLRLHCRDADGDPLEYAIVGGPGHGSLGSLDQGTGAVTYSPQRGYTGADSFTYRAADAGGGSSLATATLAVGGATTHDQSPYASCSAANAITHGDGDDEVEGTDAADSIATGAGRDRIGGGGGDDCIAAGTGRDMVAGDAGADTIRGGGGADRISGGEGRDLALLGGGGADRINAADGEAEPVNCGRGDDLAIVDRGDRVATNCERARERA